MARRRSRARENPTAGFWIALGVGVVAVGGIAYVVTRPSTASAAPPLPTHPTNDAAALGPGGKPEHLSAGMSPASLDHNAPIYKAWALAELGHMKEGSTWAAAARANAPTSDDLTLLSSLGY